MWHVTARMAWHDNGWDETVCKDLAANACRAAVTRFSLSVLPAISVFPSSKSVSPER